MSITNGLDVNEMKCLPNRISSDRYQMVCDSNKNIIGIGWDETTCSILAVTGANRCGDGVELEHFLWACQIGKIRSLLINSVGKSSHSARWMTNALHLGKSHSRHHIQFIHSNSAIEIPYHRVHTPGVDGAAKNALHIAVYTYSQFDWAIINWIDSQ